MTYPRFALGLIAPCCVLACLMFVVLATPSLADATPEAPLSSSSKPGAVRVEGVIQDDSGGLLPGAKLHFAGEAGFTADVVADGMGSFHLDLAPGTYRV